MRNGTILTVCLAFLMTACGTYTGTGTYVGAQFGSILGSAIGGISNGGRGSDVGTIIGMAGGAVVGGAIGNAKDKADRRDVHDHYAAVMQAKGQYDDTDEVEVDDRIYDFYGPDYTDGYSAAQPTMNSVPEVRLSALSSIEGTKVEIRNARFVDDNRDNAIASNELSKIIFEVVNTSQTTLFDIVPMVEETTGNKRIFISPTVHVEALSPGKGIRYTAMVKADKMKDGTAQFNIYVKEGERCISRVQTFDVATRKK